MYKNSRLFINISLFPSSHLIRCITTQKINIRTHTYTHKHTHARARYTYVVTRKIYPSTTPNKTFTRKRKHSPLLDIAAAPMNCMARTAPIRRNFPEPPRFAATDPHLTPDEPFDARWLPVLILLIRGLYRRDLLSRSSPMPSGRNIAVLIMIITDRCLKSSIRLLREKEMSLCTIS